LFKSKKEKQVTKKQQRNSGKPTTQEWVPVKDVDNNVIHRKDKYLVGAVKVQPINLSLYPEDEKERIVRQLAEVMNGLDYDYLFYTIDRPVDLDAYINNLDLMKSEENDLKKKRILEEDIKFAATMASEGDALDLYFYVIHSIKKEKSVDESVLNKRSLELASELDSIGLFAHPCLDHELRELLFIFFNPIQAAYEKVPFAGPYMPPIYQGGN